jgi:hypothetical protein
MSYIAFETLDGLRSTPLEWRDALPPYIERAIVNRPTESRRYRIARQEPVGRADKNGYFDSYLTIYMEEVKP